VLIGLRRRIGALHPRGGRRGKETGERRRQYIKEWTASAPIQTHMVLLFLLLFFLFFIYSLHILIIIVIDTYGALISASILFTLFVF
jgi:hypothetical protein